MKWKCLQVKFIYIWKHFHKCKHLLQQQQWQRQHRSTVYDIVTLSAGIRWCWWWWCTTSEKHVCLTFSAQLKGVFVYFVNSCVFLWRCVEFFVNFSHERRKKVPSGQKKWLGSFAGAFSIDAVAPSNGFQIVSETKRHQPKSFNEKFLHINLVLSKNFLHIMKWKTSRI